MVISGSAPEQIRKQALWDAFCAAHRIAETSVPLFATAPDGTVEVFAYGRDARPILRRSTEMEALLVDTVEQVLASRSESAEGVLYVMHSLNAAGRVVPLYVGKAGRYGRAGGISANLVGIRANTGKFARWGYNYAYHMGDLSAAAVPGHATDKVTSKYQRWAARLFVTAVAEAPRQRLPVRFWCTGWSPASPNIGLEFGSCPLAFAEDLLIGVAGLLFPGDLLNDEGVNRTATIQAGSEV